MRPIHPFTHTHPLSLSLTLSSHTPRPQITLADIVAFAGAVAIECVGGPRIPVQLGR